MRIITTPDITDSDGLDTGAVCASRVIRKALVRDGRGKPRGPLGAALDLILTGTNAVSS